MNKMAWLLAGALFIAAPLTQAASHCTCSDKCMSDCKKGDTKKCKCKTCDCKKSHECSTDGEAKGAAPAEGQPEHH
jgi:hypothetical protein